MTFPQIEKESLLEKIGLIIVILLMVLWSVKGLEYLTQKTREVRLDADYTEEMLRTYRD